MTEKKYNLLKEAWINVITVTGKAKSVSLEDALYNANEYRCLAGESSLQDVAILRFLIAVVYTAMSRYDVEGKEHSYKTTDEYLDYYEDVWKIGEIPPKAVSRYLSEWSDRFWLIHPEHPFYQGVCKGDVQYGTVNGIAKMNGEIFESNNKSALFSNRYGVKKGELSLPETARWLLFLNSFDDAALKKTETERKDKNTPSIGTGWLGSLGIIYATGKTLFQTIMLNLTIVNNVSGNEVVCWPKGRPSWECDRLPADHRVKIAPPDNPSALLTNLSRTFFLDIKNDKAVGYRVVGGNTFEKNNCFAEKMTLWGYRPGDKDSPEYWTPEKLAPSKQAWQEFPSLLALSEHSRMPGVVQWIKFLQSEDINILDKDFFVSFSILSVQYGAQSSSIANTTSESLSFKAHLLSDLSRSWQVLIGEMVDVTSQISEYVGYLAKNIEFASKGSADTSAEETLTQFYYHIDPAFRRWLNQLSFGEEFTEIEEARTSWYTMLKKEAMSCGKEIVMNAGNDAFTGRFVRNAKQHYSVPEAYNAFCLQINTKLKIAGKEV